MLSGRCIQLYVIGGAEDGGIDTYTIRNALLSRIDAGLAPLPDVSLVGSKNLMRSFMHILTCSEYAYLH